MIECSWSWFHPSLIHPTSRTIKTLTSSVMFEMILCLPGVLMTIAVPFSAVNEKIYVALIYWPQIYMKGRPQH